MKHKNEPFQKPEPLEEIKDGNQASGTQPVMVPIMLMNQSGQIQGQLNQGQIMSSNLQMLSSNIVLTQPNVQLIPSTTVKNPSVQINPSTWTIGSGMPSSVPSPVTPSGKKYKQTFFDDDVELIREAMKKLTKHVNSVSTVKKIQANVKFYSEFQSYLIKMLSDKNTEILDIEHQYRSNSSEDSTEKYARATKPGVPISAEMKLKHSEEMGKDAEALQIMMDNVKKAFSLKEDGDGKKLDKTKGPGSVRMSSSSTRSKNFDFLVRRSLQKIRLKEWFSILELKKKRFDQKSQVQRKELALKSETSVEF